MNTCTFCGHRDTPLSIRPMIYASVERLILENEVNNFYVGNSGNFDQLALNVLREIKLKYPHIKYHVVLAYLPANKEKSQLYNDNETILPDGIESRPPRFAIMYRNKWMVDKSVYMISYVKHNFGGAAKTLQLAKKQNLIILEL